MPLILQRLEFLAEPEGLGPVSKAATPQLWEGCPATRHASASLLSMFRTRGQVPKVLQGVEEAGHPRSSLSCDPLGPPATEPAHRAGSKSPHHPGSTRLLLWSGVLRGVTQDLYSEWEWITSPRGQGVSGRRGPVDFKLVAQCPLPHNRLDSQRHSGGRTFSGFPTGLPRAGSVKLRDLLLQWQGLECRDC